MTTRLLIEAAGPPLATFALLLAYLFGHRAGVLRERNRSQRRTAALMSTREAVLRAAGMRR